MMRLLGVSLEGLNLFCNYMDICSGLSSGAYMNIMNHLHASAESIFKLCRRKAAEEEQKENEKREKPLLDLHVSGDASWKKRGFSSLEGVTTLIGHYSGKVIDLIVKSSYCAGCNTMKNKKGTEEYDEWFTEHEEVCSKNHEGSAGKMEVKCSNDLSHCSG